MAPSPEGPYSVPPSSSDERIVTAIGKFRPEEIHGLSWSKPNFSASGHKIVRAFAIDSKKRPAREYIRCAICSSDHPKFLEGAVLWSPDRWLRLIGHVCAAKPEHFGEARYRNLRNQRQQEELDDIALNWLSANIPSMKSLMGDVQRTRALAIFVESQRKTFFHGVSNLATMLENIARRHGGVLSVTQEMSGSRFMASALADGRATGAAQSQYETISFGALLGQPFLIQPKIKRSRQLDGINEAFRRIPDGVGEEPILTLIDRGGEQEITITTGVLFRAMQRTLKLADECVEAERFVNTENLATIENWGKDSRNPMQFSLRHNGSRVAFVLMDRSQATIPTVWPRPPDLSLFRAIVAAGIELDGLLARRGL